MADNVTVDNGGLTDYSVASDKITYSGDADQAVQLVKLVTVSGSEGSKTAADVTTGVQYVEDASIAANAGQGTLVVARRDNALSTLTPAEDDAVGLRVNERGALWVSPISESRTGAQDSDGNTAQATGITNSAGSTSALSSQVYPYLYSGADYDRLRSVEAASAAPNDDTGILAVGVGPGYDRKTNPTGVAANSTSNAVTVVVNGADVVAFHVTTIGTTPGSMIFQTTNDDTAWATAGMVIKQATGPDTRIEGSFVPAVDDVYLVRTTGLRQVRYKVNAAYASGTATVEVTASAGPGMVKAVDMPGAPHNIGYAPASAGAQYSSAQTSATIGPTVTSTQRMCVTSLQIQCGGTVAATQVSIYFGTSTFSRGTSRTIFDGEFAPSATSKPGFALAPVVPWMGAADEELKITSVGAANPLTVTYWYYLITA